MFSHLFSYLSEYFNNFLDTSYEVCSELSLPGNNKHTESSIKCYRLVAKLLCHKGPITPSRLIPTVCFWQAVEMMKLFRYGTSKNFIHIKHWLTAAMLGAKLPASAFLSNYQV
jgi:hypothetical protein